MSFRWHTMSGITCQHFQKLASDPALGKHFNADYIEKIAERKFSFQRTVVKVLILNFFLMLTLILNLFFGQTEFTVFGVKISDIDKVKELVLLASASLTFYSSTISAQAHQLSAIIRGWVAVTYPKNIRTSMWSQFSGPLDVGSSFFGDVGAIGLRPTLAVTTWRVLAFITLVAVVVSIMLVSLYVHLAVIINVFSSPGLSSPWWELILAYVVVADTFAVCTWFFYMLPLPFREA